MPTFSVAKSLKTGEMRCLYEVWGLDMLLRDACGLSEVRGSLRCGRDDLVSGLIAGRTSNNKGEINGSLHFGQDDLVSEVDLQGNEQQQS